MLTQKQCKKHQAPLKKTKTTNVNWERAREKNTMSPAEHPAGVAEFVMY